MILARVRGNVVSTTKSDRLEGLKLLLVVPIDIATFTEGRRWWPSTQWARAKAKL